MPSWAIHFLVASRCLACRIDEAIRGAELGNPLLGCVGAVLGNDQVLRSFAFGAEDSTGIAGEHHAAVAGDRDARASLVAARSELNRPPRHHRIWLLRGSVDGRWRVDGWLGIDPGQRI
ncbi:MAG: hypothetical protein V2A73_13490 [Pseudomonadota bacterium]